MLESLAGSILFVVLATVLQIMLVVVAFAAFIALTKLTKKLQLNIESNTEKQLMGCIQTVVAATNQKIVEKLKAANPDNKLTEEQQTEVFEHVKGIIMAGLTSDDMNYILSKYTSIDSGLENMIEACVSYNHSSVIESVDVNIEDTEEDGIE